MFKLDDGLNSRRFANDSTYVVPIIGVDMLVQPASECLRFVPGPVQLRELLEVGTRPKYEVKPRPKVCFRHGARAPQHRA